MPDLPNRHSGLHTLNVVEKCSTCMQTQLVDMFARRIQPRPLKLFPRVMKGKLLLQTLVMVNTARLHLAVCTIPLVE